MRELRMDLRCQGRNLPVWDEKRKRGNFKLKF